MKISYNWLKNFVDFELNPQDLASVLTSVGVETSVVSSDCCWTNVVTAKILDVKKHPGADRLSLCKLSDGSKEYQIVCGAKNVAAGQVVPLAKIGASLPGNFVIKKSKIRDVESEGMICSAKELGLKKDSEGILILDENVKIGSALEDVFMENDSVLEIEIATNRGDCLSHLGIAREIGAKLHKVISMPTIKTFDVASLNSVKVKSDLCLRYMGSIISGVKVGPSPKWIIDALEKSEIRSINNIVDITNYVMIELGQPLHAFDISKISSKEIIIRNAVELESIIALDGKKYQLDPEMLVIADNQKPIAIAGIMGGEYSGVDEKTETIFLESAIFDAISIRKTSKKLNLSSDSSYRFERCVGWDIAEFALWRAANLIIDIAGGKMEAKEDLQTIKYEKTKIALRIEKMTKILGYDIEENEIAEILRFLGIDLQPRGERILCSIPSWRNDIKIEEDLIEEILRIKGYDSVPCPKKHVNTVCTTNSSAFIPKIVEKFRTKLNGLGFCEALNYSFLEIKELEKFNLNPYYKISNPVSKENEVLRPSLLPGLYRNLLLNIKQGSETVTLFEYGKIFGELGEKKAFAVIMYGKVWQEWWMWSDRKINSSYDFYFAGGIIRNILPFDDFVIAQNLTSNSYYHSGQTAAVVYKGEYVGQFGVLNPLMTDDVNGDVLYFEIDIEKISGDYVEKKSQYKAYSKFPIVKRDISIVSNKSLRFSEIEEVIKSIKKSGDILKEYSLFSVYFDESKLGKDKVVYSLRLSYRNSNKTLTDEEVNKDMYALLEKLDINLGVRLRE
ncbi:MAG: phenylalanine--tRNA ligase subunit beta [Endomicrobium sp.]|jgi:phenylalanyl-tRNA synthetase beta chain|nr:phenylalanine--tRNA ligase subunit beta [Endomicrobium sp.]